MSLMKSQTLRNGEAFQTDGGNHINLPNIPTTLPTHLVEEVSKLPRLTKEQCGHLRHFHNLVSQPDGDWSFMGGASGQDHDEGSYRYQIAFMTYAAGAAHFHRLPALRSAFKTLMEKLIAKMLRPDVWGYWYLTSHSGTLLDPDLTEMRKPWADPVCKENVMYSGHLLLMLSLYSMLFDDDRYDEEDNIVFNWDPMWWGMGAERYCYNRTKLQETILKQMEQDNWMGACCEPNTVFIVCNQFPLIATRYNDIRNETNVIDEVLPKYKKAWADRGGFISENGLFRRWYSVRQDRVLTSQDISHSAWIMGYMPWNYAQVKSLYPTIGVGFLQPTPDNRLNIRPPELANAIRDISFSQNLDPESPSVLSQAHAAISDQSSGPLQKGFKKAPMQRSRVQLPTFGFVAQWLSEVAGPPALDPLLRHADKYLNPTWTNGGLHYTRHEPGWDDEGNYRYMEPYSGNAAIGYARLNVQDGQKKMWDQPWTREVVKGRPWVEGGGLECGVDFLRGVWVEECKAVVVTVRSWDGGEVGLPLCVKGLEAGRWAIYVSGELRGVEVVAGGDDMSFEVNVGGGEVDVVVVHVNAI